MSVSDTALIVVDAQESFRHRPYWSETDWPAYLAKQQALIDGANRAGGKDNVTAVDDARPPTRPVNATPRLAPSRRVST